MPLAAPPQPAGQYSYYSVQPFLAWYINQHIYNKTHYVYASKYFNPYKKANPKSSNPYAIIQDLYSPCVDEDRFDKFVERTRIGIKSGLDGIIGDPAANLHRFSSKLNELKKICDDIHIRFFWPMLYLISSSVAENRGEIAGSAKSGSEERLIRKLDEAEFIVVLLDADRDSPIKDVVTALMDPGLSDPVGELEKAGVVP